jgi:aspartyl/asparaginyl beta-hydroxylase (cupin superfamily)
MTTPVSASEAAADEAAAAGRYPEARRQLEAASAEHPDRLDIWLKLSAMCRATGDFAAAGAAIGRALTIDPLDFSALLARATLLDQTGQRMAAGEAYGNALARCPPDERLPRALLPAVERARERFAAYQMDLVARLERGIGGAALQPDERRRVERFCANVARLAQPFPQQPTHFHYPGLPAFEFHERSRFPWIERLEAATPAIRAEFDALLASEAAELVPYIQYRDDVPLAQWRALNRSRDWTAIHLLQNGQRIERNARHCPALMALLAELPQPWVPRCSPNAMFSLLAPRTRIPPHTGVSNTRLVCHLPLNVPPGCGFRVGAETRSWEVGRAFVFDDTIEHEAWNDSDELRVVLIFDLWAWALGTAEREAVAGVMACSEVGAAEML